MQPYRSETSIYGNVYRSHSTVGERSHVTVHNDPMMPQVKNREDDMARNEDILGDEAFVESFLVTGLSTHHDMDNHDHTGDFHIEFIDDPPQKSTRDISDHSTVKEKKHYGGYLYRHNESLTATGLTRIHFRRFVRC